VFMVMYCFSVVHLIAWNSKAGKTVTHSSTEAEYYATSEIARKLFLQIFFRKKWEFSYSFPSTSSVTKLELSI
jgi:hypothetical protein